MKVPALQMETSRYGDVDFSLPEMRRQQMRAMWHSTRQPAIATGLTATSDTLGGRAMFGRPLRTLPRRSTGASWTRARAGWAR